MSQLPFIHHPADISEWLYKNLDCLTFRSEFTMHIASVIKKQTTLLSLASTSVILSWDEVKQDSSSVRIVVWF
jgi:hypothetical protein